MQGLRTETLEVRVVTLRSALSPQPMAAAGVVLALALAAPAMAVPGAASAQKDLRSVLRERTARAEVVMVVHRQA